MECTLFKYNHSDPLPVFHPHLTLSDLTDKPCGRVPSGIQGPQLTSGLWKDTRPQKTSNVKHVGTCGGKRCGLHGSTIPVSTIALKGLSLLSGRPIGQTDNNVMVIFPDSQQSLPASWRGEVDHVMGLRKASLFFYVFFFLQMWGLIICKTKFFIVIFIYLFLLNCQCVLGSCPVLYANATICLTRSKISTKVVCVHLSARPSAHVQWETIIFILSEMGSNS